jgi:hypothetical protein
MFIIKIQEVLQGQAVFQVECGVSAFKRIFDPMFLEGADKLMYFSERSLSPEIIVDRLRSIQTDGRGDAILFKEPDDLVGENGPVGDYAETGLFSDLPPFLPSLDILTDEPDQTGIEKGFPPKELDFVDFVEELEELIQNSGSRLFLHERPRPAIIAPSGIAISAS